MLLHMQTFFLISLKSFNAMESNFSLKKLTLYLPSIMSNSGKCESLQLMLIYFPKPLLGNEKVNDRNNRGKINEKCYYNFIYCKPQISMEVRISLWHGLQLSYIQ